MQNRNVLGKWPTGKKQGEEGGLNLPLATNISAQGEDRCSTAPTLPQGSGNRIQCVQEGEQPAQADTADVTEVNKNSDTGERGANLGPVPSPSEFKDELRNIFNTVGADGRHNFEGARCRVPSGLCISAWKQYLAGYHDKQLVPFLEYGWPINFDRTAVLQSTLQNHASAVQHGEDIQFYIDTELGHQALLGPFSGPPVAPTHISPLMTRPKKGSTHRRVIMDLYWPAGASIIEGVDGEWYWGREARIRLPTVQFMEDKLLELGPGTFTYKTDLSRGYRQLRVDPSDWPLLGFQNKGEIYLDICPPFGLKTSALFMQRTLEAISYIHGLYGYMSRPYLDDFGGAEKTQHRAEGALNTLQGVLRQLGVVEAVNKVCRPAQSMVWLGILFNSVDMTMRIPDQKMDEIKEVLSEWEGRQRATLRDMQRLLGVLQFVASVSPPACIFTNRMLENLRDAPQRGTESFSLGFKKDLRFSPIYGRTITESAFSTNRAYQHKANWTWTPARPGAGRTTVNNTIVRSSLVRSRGSNTL